MTSHRSSRAPARARRPMLACGITAVLLTCSSMALAAGAGPGELYASGVAAFQGGNFQRAATQLQASMDAKPSAKTALYLGNAYLKLGQTASAREAFARVLELEPDHPKRAAIEALVQDIEARVEVKLHVESTPPGATVYVDSQAKGARGTTPADIDVTVGPHTIIVAMDTYETVSRDTVIASGKTAEMKLVLQGRGCDVALSAKGPPKTRASIDGGDTMALPAKPLLRKGEHQIVFTAPTFEPQTVPFSCDGFKAATFEPTLVTQLGRLSVPAGAIVKIDGKLVAMSSADAIKGLGLPPGRHEVAVTVGDEPTRTTVVDVEAGESVRLGMPASAGADTFPARSLYVEAHGGATVALRDWNLGSNAYRDQNGVARVAPGSSGLAGFRVGFQVTSRFAIETEVQWLALPNQLDTSNGLSYTANLLFHLLPGKFTPIVEGGAGAYQVVSGSLGTDLSARGHLGVGFRGRVAKWLSLRAGARDVISKGFEAGGSNNLELLAGAEVLFR